MSDASLQQMATLLGITPSAAKRLANERLLVRSARGRFDLQASILTYVSHLREVAANRSDSPSAQATIRQKNAMAELAEARTRRMSEDLIEVSAAQEVAQKITGIWRAAFMGLPSRIRVKMGLSIPQEQQMEEIVDDRLEELAEETQEIRFGDDPKPRVERIPLNKRNSDREVRP